jgi:DNA-binding IclR family transcriptional regulator
MQSNKIKMTNRQTERKMHVDGAIFLSFPFDFSSSSRCWLAPAPDRRLCRAPRRESESKSKKNTGGAAVVGSMHFGNKGGALQHLCQSSI